MLRYSQGDVMATPIDQVQVVHSPDSGPPVPLPNCVGGALVTGQVACVLRPVVRTAQNTFVTVLTTETSRWRVRRSAPITLTTPPVAPAGLKVAEAKPYDGSVLRVKWSKVTGSSAASSYRVILDGKVRVKAPRDKTAVTIKNPGPGKHRLQVVGVNVLGVGVPARAKVTIKPLSRPRRVTAVPGAAGGPRTVVLSWRRPAESGGLAVTSYRVIVRNAAGQRVRAVKVASGRQVAIALPSGRYRFAVRARNAGGAGPWSPATPAVRPR
jgi:predicted phage tail protein